MSAGAVAGSILNFLVFAGVWMVIGTVFDKIAVVFNSTIKLMPTFQDAVNGFAMTQVAYGILPAVYFIALVINYVLTENSAASGEV